MLEFEEKKHRRNTCVGAIQPMVQIKANKTLTKIHIFRGKRKEKKNGPENPEQGCHLSTILKFLLTEVWFIFFKIQQNKIIKNEKKILKNARFSFTLLNITYFLLQAIKLVTLNKIIYFSVSLLSEFIVKTGQN